MGDNFFRIIYNRASAVPVGGAVGAIARYAVFKTEKVVERIVPQIVQVGKQVVVEKEVLEVVEVEKQVVWRKRCL